MSLPAAVLDAMLAAGCSAEQIVAAVKAAEIDAEARREAKRANNAERQRRFKARHKEQVTQDNAGNALPSVTSLDKKSPHTPKKINPISPPISPQFREKFVEAWNVEASAGRLTKALPLNAERRAKLKRRTDEFGEEAMLAAVAKLARSPFHCGQNDRGWRADIGWLLRSSENVTKALELSDAPRAPPGEKTFLDHVIERQKRQQVTETH